MTHQLRRFWIWLQNFVTCFSYRYFVFSSSSSSVRDYRIHRLPQDYLEEMGKRKSSRKAPTKAKAIVPLDTQFNCPFCNHEKVCEVKMWVLCYINYLCSLFRDRDNVFWTLLMASQGPRAKRWLHLVPCLHGGFSSETSHFSLNVVISESGSIGGLTTLLTYFERLEDVRVWRVNGAITDADHVSLGADWCLFWLDWCMRGSEWLNLNRIANPLTRRYIAQPFRSISM